MAIFSFEVQNRFTYKKLLEMKEHAAPASLGRFKNLSKKREHYLEDLTHQIIQSSDSKAKRMV
jgi:hypothetical protein